MNCQNTAQLILNCVLCLLILFSVSACSESRAETEPPKKIENLFEVVENQRQLELDSLKLIPPREPSWKNKNYSSFKRAKKCLAENVFFEARGTSKWEMIRVLNVTMNRVNSENYPNTICKVVWQDHQFSWTLDERFRIENYLGAIKKSEKEAWDLANELAERAIMRDLPDLTKGAMYYHTHTVNPKWNKNKEVKYASTWHKFY